MAVQALGYIGLNTTAIEDWAGFGTNLLGLQLAERSGQELRFRMDDRKQRLLISADAANGAQFFGWELADAAALEAMAARLEAAGFPVALGSAALAAQRRVAGLIVTQDPEGNRVELFHGAETTTDAFQPGRCLSGFRTGVNGMGHAVFNTPKLDAMLGFYRDILGFRVSDWITTPFRAYFFHCNPRHHSLALIEGPQARMHHLMLELFSLDDVGQGYDLAQQEEGRIATSLGRHTNDYMTSFYAHTPSGMLVEYGWGGRSVDMESWQAVEMFSGPSLWGHERHWAPQAVRDAALRMRLAAAARGERAPVQVLEGNHVLMPGTCPWWDRTVGAAE